jgi:uncharacterized membrane protein HdeD (DUF308 family)
VIRLILMLMGVDFVRQRWRWLAVIGVIWAALGIAIVVDAVEGVVYFPIHLFAAILLIEGLVSLAVTVSGLDTQQRNRFRLIKGILFVVLALLLFDPYPDGNFIISMLMGSIFAIGGVLRISAAVVVRFSGWRMARFAGILELIFAVLIFSPWPLPWSETIPLAIGVGLLLSGWGVLRVARRLRRLPPYASISMLTGRHGNEKFSPLILATPQQTPQAPVDLTVHVWTPVGSAHGAVRRPIIDRYAAAVDADGVISTGHAALEVPPDMYISHYPGVEIERSPDQFMHTLKATADNDVPGKFQPSYAEEAAGWCESTEKVVFREYDLNRLRAFWEAYRQDDTYNLTNRNCSSTVTHALETALEGVIGRRPRPWWTFFRMLHSPELWVATELYERADTAAWTPGLTLDYARALHSIIHAPDVGWLLLVRRGWKAYANRAATRAKRSIKRAAT